MSDESYYENYSNNEADFKKKAKEWRKKQYEKQKQKIAEQRALAKEKEKNERYQEEIDKKNQGLSDEEQQFLHQNITSGNKLELVKDISETTESSTKCNDMTQKPSITSAKTNRKKESLLRLVK